MRRARVERFINAMADAHDLLFLGEFLLDVAIDVLFRANLFKHVDNAFVSTAVQWTFESADG